MVEQFKGEYEWLSNFTLCDIEYEGITYPSVEHFYVAMKSTDPTYRLEVSKIETSGKAKRRGQKLEKEGNLRSDWDDIKISTMRYALQQKYNTEPFRTLLLETKNMKIQEGNYWKDTFWGIYLETGEGKNILGKMIMEIRETL